MGTAALELLASHLESRVYAQDIREKDLPQETGQNALCISKRAATSDRRLWNASVPEPTCTALSRFRNSAVISSAGSKIQADGKEVGEITSSASLPAAGGEFSVRSGYLCGREAALPGKQCRSAAPRQLWLTYRLLKFLNTEGKIMAEKKQESFHRN